MALLFFDSCGDYYATADLPQPSPWLSALNATIVAGGQTGNGLNIANSSGFGYVGIPNISLQNSSVGGSPGFGFGVAVSAPVISTNTIIPIAQLSNGSVYWTVGFRQISSVWYIAFQDNSGNNILGAFTPVLNTFYYVEFLCSTLAANALVTLRVNGTTIVQGITQTTIIDNPFVNMYFGGPNWGSSNVVANVVYDNAYVFSTVGGLVTNLLGPQVVNVLTPAGNGRVNQWTPLSGSNFSNVNTIPPPGDTKYVFSSTVGNIDDYTLSALPGGLGAINGAQTTITGRNTVSGRSVAMGFGNGSTEVFGNVLAPGTTYAMASACYDTNPFTLVAWQSADFSTLQAAIQQAS